MRHRTVDAGLDEIRHLATVEGLVAISKFPGFGVLVPVVGFRNIKILSRLEAKGFDVMQRKAQGSQLLPARPNAELVGLLDHRSCVRRRRGQGNHVGFGGLCLQQLGRKLK